MKANIAVIPGDGIGPEVTSQAIKVLNKVAKKYNHQFIYEYLLMGGISIDKHGIPLTDETLLKAKNSDAVLLGAVGGPKWDIPGRPRPEQGLLGIRTGLGVFANLRPAVLFSALKEACPLKPELVGESLNILIVRELTGGIYFGKSGRSKDGMTAYDTETYSKAEITRLLRKAAEAALQRKKKVTVVDKANVMESSRLWREVSKEFFLQYPDLTVDYMYVDNAAMQLIKNPTQFDVIATSNLFGDILSDEMSMLTGSIGMLPSASLGEGKTGLYEPIHGSAPDIAGQNKANPCATILAAAMMLLYSFDMKNETKVIEDAVEKFINDGYRTSDLIINKNTNGFKIVGTEEAGDIISDNI
ncbi:MAG: leuB [Clostridia bacterium]|nr:leuB [Clostridia bacterium]